MSEARIDPIAEIALRTETLLNATLPHLATKAEVAGVRADLAALPHLATKAEVADVRTDLAKTEARLIRWAIGVGTAATVLLSAQLWSAVQILLHAH